MTQLPRVGSAASDREVAQLRTYLEGLEGELAIRELEYVTRHAELQDFESRYLAAVGARLALHDQLSARVAALAAKRRPTDAAAAAAATEAARRAAESADALNRHRERPTNEFHPSDALKKLYREGARAVHPDLGSTEEDRRRREVAMAALNAAYERGDAVAMQRIIDEFKAGNLIHEATSAEQQLALLKSKIAKVERRLAQLAEQLHQLDASELYQLLRRVDVADGKGRDLLAEMAAELDRENAALQAVVDELP